MKTRWINIALSMFILAGMLTGCAMFQGTTPEPQPTPDENRLRTEVAQTVVARLTYESALTQAAKPSATVEIVSPTLETFDDTATLSPTLPIITYTPTATVPSPTPSETIRVVYPTWTPTYYPDRAELVAQSPADGSSFTPGLGFDLVFTIKNTGDRTWTTSFYLKFASGISGKSHSGQAVTLAYLPHAVAPGETVQIVIDMIAPQSAGSYNSTWTLINDDGTSILSPNLVFYVSG